MISNCDSSLTLLILAAGIGSRYGGIKQLEEVGPFGETLIDYSIFDAHRAGFKKVVFVIREEMKGLFEERFDRKTKKLEIEYAFQRLDDLPNGFKVPKGRTKPWGTGQAVLAAKKQIKGPFAVINGDDYYGPESYWAMAKFLEANRQQNSFAMIGFQLKNTLSDHGAVSRGICETTADGKLRSIEEVYAIETLCDYRGDEMVSMNMWGFTPVIFQLLDDEFEEFLTTLNDAAEDEFYLPVALNKAIHSGTATVQVLKTGGKWMGMTYQNDRQLVSLALNRLIEKNKYPSPLWRNE